MLVLEQKLSILKLGPSQTRRNPALDVLTGRVPDERLQLLRTSLLSGQPTPEPGSADIARSSSAPTAMVLPVAAIRMAAVARSNRVGYGSSPWLKSSAGARPRLRLISPPRSRFARVPWLGSLLVWLRVDYPAYTSPVRSPRPHLVS